MKKDFLFSSLNPFFNGMLGPSILFNPDGEGGEGGEPAGGEGGDDGPSFYSALKNEKFRKDADDYFNQERTKLKRKNDELLDEKTKGFEARDSKIKELEEQLNGMKKKSGDNPPEPGDTRYSRKEVDELLGKKDSEWQGKLGEVEKFSKSREGLLQDTLLANQMTLGLLKAGVKEDLIDLAIQAGKKPYSNGNGKFEFSLEGEKATITILDKDGRPATGEKGFMSWEEFGMALKQERPSLFKENVNVGSGGKSSGSPQGGGSGKMSRADYEAMDPKDRRKVKAHEVDWRK